MTILASAAQVIRCFGPDCATLSVTDLCARLGMPKSNASRLLRAMRDVGMLESVGDTKRYRPGLMLVDVARGYVASSSLLERANTAVAAVSSDCGHTGYVSIRDGRWVTAVIDHQGVNPLRVASNIGRRLPAAATATGRTLLARLTNDDVRALYAGDFPVASDAAPQNLDELIGRLVSTRRDGYALSHDEATRGVTGIAAAVGDPTTGEAVSLCVVCPTATTDEGERRGIALALREHAAAIAALTGDARSASNPGVTQ